MDLQMAEQSMRSALAPVYLGGSLVGAKGHICAFFSSAEDEYRTLLPFIKDGLEANEAAFHTVDPARANDHVTRHLGAGIDVDGYRRKGQLKLKSWDEVHLLGGKLTPKPLRSCLAARDWQPSNVATRASATSHTWAGPPRS